MRNLLNFSTFSNGIVIHSQYSLFFNPLPIRVRHSDVPFGGSLVAYFDIIDKIYGNVNRIVLAKSGSFVVINYEEYISLNNGYEKWIDIKNI